MDKIDRKIIAQLQRNGRVSLTELADQVGISLSPCQRRVRNLEQNGVITQYRAVIAPDTVGLNFSAIVFVTAKDTTAPNISAFETAVAEIPEIIQAQRLFGDPDYMLNIITKDLNSFQKLYDSKLSSLPNVLRLSSTLVMKNILVDRELPL